MRAASGARDAMGPTVNNSASSGRWSSAPLKPRGAGEGARGAGYLVAVGSRTARFRRKHKNSLVVVTLLALIFVLAILVLVLSVLYSHAGRRSPAVCWSRSCLRSAATLALSMDTSADPCTDFYQFACGGWGSEHPRPDGLPSYDWFREQQGRVFARVRDFLAANLSQDLPLPVRNAKVMYDTCMDVETLEKLGVDPALELMKSMGLDGAPRFLNLTAEESGSAWEWVEGVSRVKGVLGMDVLVGCDMFSDPRNSSRYRLALGSPETTDPFPSIRIGRKRQSKKRGRLIRKMEPIDFSFIFDERHADGLEASAEEDSDRDSDGGSEQHEYLVLYAALIKMFVTADEEVQHDNVTETELDRRILLAAHEYLSITNDLYDLESDNSTESNDDLLLDIPAYTASELDVATGAPSGLWGRYLGTVLASAGSAETLRPDDDKVLVSGPDLRYLTQVLQHIATTPPHTTHLYVWMKVVEAVAGHTTTAARLVTRQLEQLGRRGQAAGPRESPRGLHCATVVNDMLGMALAYAIADPTFLNHTKPKVEAMIDEIKNGLAHLVGRARWMDDNTKVATYYKIMDMRSLVGFPEWVHDREQLERHYEGAEVRRGAHLRNMAAAVRARVRRSMDALHQPHNLTWATHPTEVNAYHTFQENTITVPLVMLQYPFFDLGLDALNYGSLGTILGHEITHGFDNFGRHFDKDGNLRSWWSNATVAAFENVTQCFVDQYNGYYIEEIDQYVDGRRTLGENIADNGGVREALVALRRTVRRQRHPPLTLPGFHNYTYDQLFFLSYANLWCGVWTPAALRGELTDEHAPQRVRARAALHNSREFATAFKCPPPETTCTLF